MDNCIKDTSSYLNKTLPCQIEKKYATHHTSLIKLSMYERASQMGNIEYLDPNLSYSSILFFVLEDLWLSVHQDFLLHKKNLVIPEK